MPIHVVSSVAQDMLSAGQLIMVCVDNTGAGLDATIRFSPAYTKILNPQWSPFQHINESVEGGLHIFQFSANEGLVWDITFSDIPSFNSLDDPREQSHGYIDLLSFIQLSLNYSASTAVIYAPTGQIEPAMVYLGGIETFAEAEGSQNNRSQRANRWGGSLKFMRRLPWTYN